MSSTVAFLKGYFRLVDWRLVAAVALPVWTFLFGVLVTWKPASSSPAPVELAAASPTEPVPPPPEPIHTPREVVIRHTVVPVPVIAPVVALNEPAAVTPTEFTLPPNEVLGEDRCKTFDTKVRFHTSLPEATEAAKNARKLVMVMHISGDFDDPGFT